MWMCHMCGSVFTLLIWNVGKMRMCQGLTCMESTQRVPGTLETPNASLDDDDDDDDDDNVDVTKSERNKRRITK